MEPALPVHSSFPVRQLGGKALRVRLAHTGTNAVQPLEYRKNRQVPVMRCSGVCTMWQPARNRSGMRRVTGNSRPRRSVRWLPPTRTQDEASRGASTPKHAASHSRNTASVGVKKFFQNGRHSIAPSAAHQPLTMAARAAGQKIP